MIATIAFWHEYHNALAGPGQKHAIGVGDLDGQAVWLRILRAIDELLDTDAKTVH